MKRFYLFLLATVAMLTTANAGTMNLVKMDFESGDPASLGWASANLPAGMTITGDEYGNFFQFSLGASNGRSCYNIWGSDVYTDKLPTGVYHVEFEWCYNALANNQFGTEISLFSGEAPAANNAVLNAKDNTLFSVTESADNHNLFFVNGDTEKTFSVDEGAWFKVLVDVDVNAHKLTYQVVDQLSGQEVYAEGTREFAEDADMLISGINIYNARYQSIVQIDNLMVQVITDYDIANVPSIALTGVYNEERTYTIKFDEEETLNIKGTDGTESTISFMDCNGEYKYTTTTSGTLEAWTTSGSATSEKVPVEIECVIIPLPEASIAITNADAGFAKDLTITVDNSEVATKPTIYISYEFKDEAGNVVASAEDKFSGEVVSVDTKGTLTVQTIAIGFGTTTSTYVNDSEFEVKNLIDFQHMTGDDLTAKGFEKAEDLDLASGGGINTWTSGNRLYYRIETGETDDDGNPTYTDYVVWGASENGYTPISRYKFYQSKLTQEAAHTILAPFYTWYYNDGVVASSVVTDEDGNVTGNAVDANGAEGGSVNVQVWPGIGFVFGGIQGDTETYDPAGVGYGNIRVNNATLGVDGLTDDEFIIVSKIGGYGNTANHPIFPVGTDPETAKADYLADNIGGYAEVYKGTETFQLYRIDTAISRVTVLTPKGGTSIQTVGMQTVSDKNAPVYNLNGVRISGALKKGVYIKQGKKFIVK